MHWAVLCSDLLLPDLQEADLPNLPWQQLLAASCFGTASTLYTKPAPAAHTHLQEAGLAASVLSDEAVAAADGQLDAAILDELIAADAQAEAVNLDVTRGGARRQHACMTRGLRGFGFMACIGERVRGVREG